MATSFAEAIPNCNYSRKIIFKLRKFSFHSNSHFQASFIRLLSPLESSKNTKVRKKKKSFFFLGQKKRRRRRNRSNNNVFRGHWRSEFIGKRERKKKEMKKEGKRRKERSRKKEGKKERGKN